MKGTVIEWGPAIIAGVLFAGTVGVIGYNSATNFLFLTNAESTESQLNTLHQDIEGQCTTPNVPSRTLTVSLPGLNSIQSTEQGVEADIGACESGNSWSKNYNCDIEIEGFDEGNAKYEVEVSGNPDTDPTTVTVSAERIGEASCPS